MLAIMYQLEGSPDVVISFAPIRHDDVESLVSCLWSNIKRSGGINRLEGFAFREYEGREFHLVVGDCIQGGAEYFSILDGGMAFFDSKTSSFEDLKRDRGYYSFPNYPKPDLSK